MTGDLFENDTRAEPRTEALAPGALLLRGFALAASASLLDALPALLTTSPWRHLVTPGGRTMSVSRRPRCAARASTSARLREGAAHR